MNAPSQKMAFSILMAAMFVFCIILAIETGFSFAWMLGGFVLIFVVSFVFMYMRAGPFVMLGTVAVLLVGYGLYKLIGGDSVVWKPRVISVAIGGFAALLTVMMIQFGWVKPHTESAIKVEDYRSQQQAIYEQEKAQKQGAAPVVQDPGPQAGGQGKPPV